MRPVSVDPHNTRAALVELMKASQENDVVDITTPFTFTAPPTQTLTLDTAAPNLNNVVQVLGTLLQIMQRGGIDRTA